MHRFCLAITAATVMIAASTISISAQQTDVSISPSATLPSSGAGTRAGLGLTVAGSSRFGLRAAGRMALRNTNTGVVGANTWLPPWGADVDAALALSGRPFGARNRSPATFVFLGLGASATDTANVRTIGKNWSYGLGTMLPLGSVLDLFAESRWRIPGFVLPTATPRPVRSKEYRFGMSFHVPR